MFSLYNLGGGGPDRFRSNLVEELFDFFSGGVERGRPGFGRLWSEDARRSSMLYSEEFDSGDAGGGGLTEPVAEIAPKILEWARGPMRTITNGCLDDPRVQVVQDDVAVLIGAACEGYDCILLDVDNGPEGLTRRINDWLYSEDGLASARRALRPGGILAIWSATHDDRFAGRLARNGFSVKVIETEQSAPLPGDNELGRHVIILGCKH